MKFLTILLLIYLNLYSFEAKVIKISDGDTITVLADNKTQIKVRLYGIDAPEKKQAYGEKSRKFLANLIAGQIVEIKEKGKDKYKRVLGVVYYNGQDINAKMVSGGYAWAFIRYSKDYISDEKYAKNNRAGLWKDSLAIAPWEFRKKR